MPSGRMRTISPGPRKCVISYSSVGKAELSLVTAMAPSFWPTTIGVRPHESRAAMMPSSVSRSMEQDPSILRKTFSMPSTKSFPFIIRRAVSSVGLILPLENSLRCMFSLNSCCASCSMLLIFATVTKAKRPKCEFISMGCASVSLITPIPLLPTNLSNSGSKRVRKYVFSRLWMLR